MAVIDTVDFFYLRMGEVEAISDNSQDSLLVRVSSGGDLGWGECDAAPLVSIASFIAPMSHGFCQPVGASVLGQRLDGPDDIARINREVRGKSLDLLQTSHTLAGIDMALWDLLGRRRGEPVWRLLGHGKSTAKTPYASQLFGDDPQQTLAKGKAQRSAGFRAVKFGWGPYGRGDAATDGEHIAAAREGLGEDGILLVDAGTVWVDDVDAAAARLEALTTHKATWLEEPFISPALGAYKELAARAAPLRIAGGEGAHNFHMAQQMIDFAGIGYVQIDAGRMGVSDSRRVADYAAQRDVRFVNHTFNSHIALSASLQAFAGHAQDDICEFPVEAKPLSREITQSLIERDADGLIRAPDAPGLGLEIDMDALARYLVPTEIHVGGQTLYSTPQLT
ncbi:MAG: mandelate racemase/muconate lactonizing enzyme family protein [Alphaproteobacteria bacterium]|jgi:L-alanine-DL-glutamate epimerase-like enolase superfamily enzyme|nr:mandelate racemase/muconate lactonizing enzyme family protein [Alphaproteobacteria bacterium]MDP6831684.1 mandelate racemase/muconate lactonizing enzyme family protein [Alphaproteobacteria bacterium]MDP6875469.1 mandelate racemase/muconate lactonizing enzyme family protein [Alphaproteobacteria bacterium]